MVKPKKAPTEEELAMQEKKAVVKAVEALAKACQNDELGKAKKALDAGAPVDVDVTGDAGSLTSPMHLAASFGAYEVCKYLFEVGGSELIEAKNKKGSTAVDVAVKVGEDKIVRLLQALLKGQPPPVEVDSDEDVETMPMPDSPLSVGDSKSSPVDEMQPLPSVAEAAAAPGKDGAPRGTVAAPPEATSSLLITTFFLSRGKMGIFLEKNVVVKVTGDPEGAAATQAAAEGVQPGWVLRKVGAEAAVVHTRAVMKQLAAAIKDAGAAGAECTFERPEGDTHHCAVCDQFLPRAQFKPSQLLEGPGQQRCSPCGYAP